MDIQDIQQKSTQLRNEVSKVIIGMDDTIDYLLIALYCGGHVILEGVPGIAKTLLSKCMAKTIDCTYSRIQFTPDLMPTDIIGPNVFNLKNSIFEFHKGPIFANIVLIDEINRAPAKTQAALFEVMEEKHITMDGQKYDMDFPFLVMATQNPIDQEGTYRLPEAQLDRFLFKLIIDYPKLEHEFEILKRFGNNYLVQDLTGIQKMVNRAELKEIQEFIQAVYVKEEILQYIANIIFKTRNHESLFLGASPRASLSILKSSKCYAAMCGRDFVTPEDIQFVAYSVMNHRIILTAEKELQGLKTSDVIKSILQEIEVPR